MFTNMMKSMKKWKRKKVDSSKAHKEQEKKPKYIANLLKSAAMRKREQERRVERSVQREREKEGDKFADKESFVTAAYRQKMLDQAEEEERLRKQDELDALHDVTKQKDLSQFYRNLLNRNIAMGAEGDKVDDEKTEDAIELEKSGKLKEIRKHRQQESTRAGREVLQKRWAKEKDILEEDERRRNIDVLHCDKGSMRYGSQRRSNSSDASTSDDSSDRKRKKKQTAAAEKSRVNSEKLSYRSYRRREDGEGWMEKRPILQTSSSDSEENSHNKKSMSVSERNRHRKGEGRGKDRNGSEIVSSRNRKGSSGRRSSSRERRRKKSKRNMSFSESSLSANETRKETMKSEQKSKRGSRIYDDDREVHENRENKRSRNKSSKKELTHNPKVKTYYSDDGDDDNTKRIEMSSRHAGESSRGKSSIVEERKDNKEKETVNEKKLKIFARHNDAESISSARERYLARKRARIIPQIHEDDSDD